GSGRPPPTLPQDLDDDRNHGDDDHDDDYDVNVVSDVRDRAAQQVAHPGHAGHPSHTAGDIVDEEAAVSHLADAGDDRRKGTNDGDEACDHDRLGAMALVEAAGPPDGARLEEPGLGEDDSDQNGVAAPPDQIVEGMGPGEDPEEELHGALTCPARRRPRAPSRPRAPGPGSASRRTTARRRRPTPRRRARRGT